MKAQTELVKSSIELHPDNAQHQVVMFLYEASNFLKEKHGFIPEEIDKACIENTGMRFNMLIPTLFEINIRIQMVQEGFIQDYLWYIPEMGVENGDIHSISEEEHEIFCLLANKVLNAGEGITRFIDFLLPYCSK